MKNKDISLKFDFKSMPKQAKRLVSKLIRYQVIIFIVLVVGLFGYLIIQISTVSQKEPSDSDLVQQLSTVKRLKIDQSSIDKILQLEDQNVVVQSLFDDARNNPFTE